MLCTTNTQQEIITFSQKLSFLIKNYLFLVKNYHFLVKNDHLVGQKLSYFSHNVKFLNTKHIAPNFHFYLNTITAMAFLFL